MPRLFSGIEIPASVARRLTLVRGSPARPGSFHPRCVARSAPVHVQRRATSPISSATSPNCPSSSGSTALGSFGGRKPRAIFAAVAMRLNLSANAATTALPPPLAYRRAATTRPHVPPWRGSEARALSPSPRICSVARRTFSSASPSRCLASCCAPRAPRSAAVRAWWSSSPLEDQAPGFACTFSLPTSDTSRPLRCPLDLGLARGQIPPPHRRRDRARPSPGTALRNRGRAGSCRAPYAGRGL